MYRLNNIKQNILIVSFVALLTGCGGGGGSTTSTDSTTSTTASPKVVEIQTSEPIITENSATIEWIQNDYTTKLVEYGTSKKYGSELLVKEEGTITLYNLQPNTIYHYRIFAEDKNGREVVSRDKTFTILEQSTQPIVAEPVITEPIITEPIVTEPVVTEPIVTEPIVTEPVPTPVCKNGTAQQLGQIKDSISGAGLVDITVTIAGCSTKTDADGYYTLNNIVENENAVINFEKEGYLLGSTLIQIKELSGDNTPSTNYLEYAIDTYDYQWSYDSQTSSSGAHIDIPDSVYIDTDGNFYTGTVAASLELMDVTTNEGKALFTGSFEGMNTNGEIVPFVSYGLISLSFKDANGNALNLTSDSGATLTFDAVPSLEEQHIIPLWYYDYEQGVWIEEGYAELQADSTYKGEISHSGTWSLNKPIENDPGIYRGRIVNEDGLPISDVRLQAIGDNWISHDLSTDEDGMFEIEVIPGKSFLLSAYNYKDKYKANYNNTIPAIASGDIVED